MSDFDFLFSLFGLLPNFKAPWTDEQFRTLVDLLAAGQTIPEIAKAMGRSQEGVRAQAWKRGLLPSRVRRSERVTDA